MGSPKALLAFEGSTFIETLTKTILESGISKIIATIPEGSIGEQISKCLVPYPVHACINHFAHREMLGSVQSVLQSPDFSANAILICPVDMPFLSAEIMRDFLSAHKATKHMTTLLCASFR